MNNRFTNTHFYRQFKKKKRKASEPAILSTNSRHSITSSSSLNSSDEKKTANSLPTFQGPPARRPGFRQHGMFVFFVFCLCFL
jgi:hypothetical protein